MTGQTLVRHKRQRDELEVFTGGSLGSPVSSNSLVEFHRRWGCPTTNATLRAILDRLVSLVADAATQPKPGWIAEIGCQGGLWTEWIGLTMKSCHTEPGAVRLKLAVIDQSPSTTQSAIEYLRIQCLPEPAAVKICHDGKFTLDGPADIVFSFETLANFSLELMNAYCESVARVLRPGGKFLVTLPTQMDLPGNRLEPFETNPRSAVAWTEQGLTFAEEIRETFETCFTYSPDEAGPVLLSRGQAFFEFTRQTQPG